MPEIGVLVGYPEYAEGQIYNSALLLRGGRELAHHRKACLPNYKVFDEKRYFTPGTRGHGGGFRRLSARAADLRGRLGAAAGRRRPKRARRRGCC